MILKARKKRPIGGGRCGPAATLAGPESALTEIAAALTGRASALTEPTCDAAQSERLAVVHEDDAPCECDGDEPNQRGTGPEPPEGAP